MKSKNMISTLLLGTGIAFMLYGVLVRQENLIVLNKAIRICMECIGIG
ncbi:MAG: CD1871A family CXXC motif-containing protein [Eubacteriales bacterium]|nr:CD1871A family CXXC motif-containing protein [Eubacteriales bacterium]